ncbi:MAG: hypothetical protein ABI970_12775, partial [Chloroflexota bacterium]
MAPWIAHLRVAEALSNGLLSDKTAFAYGSLAPDSGKPNADWTAFDPPKEVTHFLRRGEGEDKIHDLKFYRDYVLTSPHFEDDFEDYSFRRGYFYHLVCDNLWSRRINAAYKQIYPELIDNPTSTLWNTIKHDWYDLDFRYLRDHPEFSFWQIIMTTPNPPTYLPFLSVEGFTHSLDHIRTFYSTVNPEHNLDHPYIYLNEAGMNRWVDDTFHTVVKLHFLLVSRDYPPLEDLNSAVSLLDATDIAPYEFPL